MRPSSYCFLLGAGASKAAGIDTMPEMGDKFCQAARGEFTGLINQINASPLRFWTPKDRNIEVLLKWLNRQKRRTQLTATGHAHNLRCREIIALTLQARSFILRETSKAPQIDELLSWGSLLRRQKVVDIFSLNYDTVVEDVCHRLRIPCYDGFSVHGAWAPQGLRNCPKGVRLWKIHGSVTWIKQQGLPVRISSPAQRQQAAGHQASLTEETALIWPALDKTAPESSLFHLFDETLRRLLPQRKGGRALAHARPWCHPKAPRQRLARRVLTGLLARPAAPLFLPRISLSSRADLSG